MKKLFALTLSVLMILGVFCGCKPQNTEGVSSQVAANPASDFEYKISDNETVYITKYIGSDDTVVIPSKIDGKIVDAISNYSFKKQNIKSVVIPDTVAVIGMEAFFHCANLQTVYFGSGLKKIGTEAFFHCDKLEKVLLPEGIEEVGIDAFRNCYVLQEVYIPKSLVRLDSGSFVGCTALTTITFGEGTEKLNGYAVFAGAGVEEITIPESVTEISNYFFGDLPALKSIKTFSDAPKAKSSIVYRDNLKDIIIYYKEGMTGWDQPPYNEYTLKAY